MIELVIKYENGSVYWKENFNSQEECDKWLDNEKAQPYWKPEFTYESHPINLKDPVKEAEKEAKRTLRESKHQAKIDQLKLIDWQTVKDITDIKPILKVLVEDFIRDQE